jgi:hypothetical protein
MYTMSGDSGMSRRSCESVSLAFPADQFFYNVFKKATSASLSASGSFNPNS